MRWCFPGCIVEIIIFANIAFLCIAIITMVLVLDFCLADVIVPVHPTHSQLLRRVRNLQDWTFYVRLFIDFRLSVSIEPLLRYFTIGLFKAKEIFTLFGLMLSCRIILDSVSQFSSLTKYLGSEIIF